MLRSTLSQTVEVEVHGDCGLSTDRLAKSIVDGRPEQILEASGQFVVVAKQQTGTTIVTSRGGAKLHFYTQSGDQIIDGATVLEVLSQTKSGWRWNYRALGDYLLLDHTLGDETIVEGVKRTPPGSILRSDTTNRDILAEGTSTGAIHLRTKSPPIESLRFSLSKACDAIESEVMEAWRGEGDVLCLTGGLDSRLLLAVFLRNGIRPDCLVCGQPGSDDLLIARQLADRYGLPLRECEVTASDFVDDAPSIVECAGGALPVSHWPGILLARHAKGARLFLGFNGEAARNYYGRGRASMLRRRTASVHSKYARQQVVQSNALPLTKTELASLHPSLGAALSDDAWSDRVQRFLGCDGRLQTALDRAFVNQRTPNKTGADLAAISIYSSWVVPFCGTNWLAHVSGVPWHRRLDDTTHRSMIDRLVPTLLEIPTNGENRRRMGRRSRRLEPHQEHAQRHFFDQTIYEDESLVAWMESAMANLDDLVDWREFTSSAGHIRTRLRFALASVGALRGIGSVS